MHLQPSRVLVLVLWKLDAELELKAYWRQCWCRVSRERKQRKERTHRPWHTVISEQGECKERMIGQAQVRVSFSSRAGSTLSSKSWAMTMKAASTWDRRAQLFFFFFLIKVNSLILSYVCELSFHLFPYSSFIVQDSPHKLITTRNKMTPKCYS